MPKKCKVCGDKFTPVFSSFDPVCSNNDCRTTFALNHVKKQREKREKEAKQQWAKEKKILKEKLKTRSDYEQDLQKEINTIVRLIDKDWPCISSGRNLGKSYDAGHLWARAAYPPIRYHLFNIFAQSVHDNQWKSGNGLEFAVGIEKTFGVEIKEYCHSLKSHPPLKLTVDELKDKTHKARGIVKFLKLQDRKFTLEERISLRKKFNEEIGIYNESQKLHHKMPEREDNL